MRTSSSLDLDAPVGTVAALVDDLSAYAQWMPMIHGIERADADGETAWSAELRAKVGPFARSKRLRMVRTVRDTSPDGAVTVVFARREVPARQHSAWTMTVRVSPRGPGCTVAMDLEYGGSLWTAGVLDRVLASNIEAGKKGLAAAVNGSTH